ncbi:MAG: DUF3990 domain-containing protein [Bacteroidaceae bacterium]|nr:DUF3990 domain-containing protein [Bacteroidaceae bacterium]
MRLYHGTNVEFEEIDLTKSKVGKDFGCGFCPKDYVVDHLTASKKDIHLLRRGGECLFSLRGCLKSCLFY